VHAEELPALEAGRPGFERLGVEWVPETAQPLKRGKLRLMHGHVWHRVQETGTCTGPDAP